MTYFYCFSSNLLSLVAHVPGRFEVDRVCCKSFCRHYFSSCSIKFGLATSDHGTLHFYFTLAVSGSIGDKFEFTYLTKSELFDVFKQDKCPSLDFKRFFACLFLRRFDGRRKTLIHGSVSKTFYWIVQKSRKTISFSTLNGISMLRSYTEF